MFPGTDKFLFTVLMETVTLIMSVVFRVPLVMCGSTDWILQLDFGCSKMTMAGLAGRCLSALPMRLNFLSNVIKTWEESTCWIHILVDTQKTKKNVYYIVG